MCTVSDTVTKTFRAFSYQLIRDPWRVSAIKKCGMKLTGEMVWLSGDKPVHVIKNSSVVHLPPSRILTVYDAHYTKGWTWLFLFI